MKEDKHFLAIAHCSLYVCILSLLISLLINVVLVHPSQYTLAPKSTIGSYSTVNNCKPAAKLQIVCDDRSHLGLCGGVQFQQM